MKSWPFSVKLGAGVAVAVLALLLVSRMGRQPEAPPSTEDVVPVHGSMKEGDRIQQRLDQIRASHAAKSNPDAGGKIAARDGAPAAKNMQRPRGSDAAGAAVPPDAAEDAPPFDEDPDDIPALKTIALGDPDPERRLSAVTMLGASEDPQVIPMLAQALSDQDEEVRMAALQALSDFTDEPPVEAIESALNDPSPDIRFEALDVLSDIGGERVQAAVEKALNDPDEDVRSLAEGIVDFEQLYEGTPGAGDDTAAAAPVAENPQPAAPADSAH